MFIHCNRIALPSRIRPIKTDYLYTTLIICGYCGRKLYYTPELTIKQTLFNMNKGIKNPSRFNAFDFKLTYLEL